MEHIVYWICFLVSLIFHNRVWAHAQFHSKKKATMMQIRIVWVLCESLKMIFPHDARAKNAVYFSNQIGHSTKFQCQRSRNIILFFISMHLKIHILKIIMKSALVINLMYRKIEWYTHASGKSFREVGTLLRIRLFDRCHRVCTRLRTSTSTHTHTNILAPCICSLVDGVYAVSSHSSLTFAWTYIEQKWWNGSDGRRPWLQMQQQQRRGKKIKTLIPESL